MPPPNVVWPEAYCLSPVHLSMRASVCASVCTSQRWKSWPQHLWSLISQKPCQIDSWSKLTTYRKPHIANPVVTWHMTSLDPKRSRSWPRYLLSSISRQPCEIYGRFILTTNKKLHLASPMVTWPMMLLDHERLRSWFQYHWSLILHGFLDISAGHVCI